MLFDKFNNGGHAALASIITYIPQFTSSSIPSSVPFQLQSEVGSLHTYDSVVKPSLSIWYRPNFGVPVVPARPTLVELIAGICTRITPLNNEASL